jgi:hypothetical protein
MDVMSTPDRDLPSSTRRRAIFERSELVDFQKEELIAAGAVSGLVRHQELEMQRVERRQWSSGRQIAAKPLRPNDS